MPQFKKAFISNLDKFFIFVHDGIFYATSGAGNSNACFIKTLAKLYPEIPKTICPIEASKKGASYNKQHYEKMQNLIKESNGEIIPVSNGTNGEHIFGDITNWSIVDENCLNIIKKCSIKGELTVVISFDTAFAGLISKLCNYPNITHIHIPRSTGLIQNKNNLLRSKFEKKMYTHVNNCENSYIGCTSPYMKQHLGKAYGVRKDQLLDITNGVLLDKPNRKLDHKEILVIEKGVGIPRGAKYVLAYGRAERYKGYHILLKALSSMEPKKRPLFFIIAVEYTPDSDYVVYLKKLIKQLKLKGVLTTKFDATLPSILQQSPNLLAVVVPSLKEPFGLIPIENLANAHSKAPIIAARTGGLRKQIIHGRTGFLYKKTSPTDLAKQIKKVMTLSDRRKEVMSKAGFDYVKANYNYEQNIKSFFRELEKRELKRYTEKS